MTTGNGDRHTDPAFHVKEQLEAVLPLLSAADQAHLLLGQALYCSLHYGFAALIEAIERQTDLMRSAGP